MTAGGRGNLLDTHATCRCRYCGREVAADSRDWCDYNPFCSQRCRLADLDRWFEGEYIIIGEPLDEGDEDADAQRRSD